MKTINASTSSQGRGHSASRILAGLFAGWMAVVAPAVAQPAGVTITHEAEGPVLQRVDLETGELDPIGPLGLPGRVIVAVAFLPSGELVGVDSAQDELVRIDPESGQGTVVGALGVDWNLEDNPADLAADACGRLWMIRPALDQLSSELYRLDPLTGAAESHGTFSPAVFGLAAAGETLYGIAELGVEDPRLVSLDPLTSTVVEVAVIEGLSFFRTRSLDFRGDLELVDYGWRFAPVPVPPLQTTVRFDLTGEVGHVITHPSDPARLGLAVAPPPGQCVGGSPLPIPTASPLGLAALALGLAAAGALTLARRRLPARRS
jgi:hypothetical protein